MRPLKLDLRKLFRALGKREQQQWANAILQAGPAGPPKKGSRKGLKRNKGTKGARGAGAQRSGGPTGGSLSYEITKPGFLSVKRWGYVLRVAKLGQKLTWLVRGTRFQPARPIDVPVVDTDTAAEQIGTEIASAFNAWDESTDRRSRA